MNSLSPRAPSPPRLPFIDKARAALKAAQIAFSGFGGSPYGYGTSGSAAADRWYYGLPGTNLDWGAMAGDLWQSSVVAIALHWIGRNITEPPPVVRTRGASESEDDPDHPLCQLLNNPNPYYGYDNLTAALALSYCTAGNGYWVKARGKRSGQAKELLYIPHWQLSPVYPTDGSKYIDHYAYRVDGRQPERIEASDVVHFRFGLDPYNYRLGWAPLGPQLRQVATDNEASTYEAALLVNMGISPVMLSAGDPAGINPENRQRLEDKINSKFTGDGRGRWLVVGCPMKADVLGVSPEHMAIPGVRRCAAARVVASLGLSLALLQLDDRSTGFDNGGQHNEARRAAYQDCLIPMLKTWGAVLTKQLGPDFDLKPNQEVAFDLSKVEALAEDSEAVSVRACREYSIGGITRALFLKRIGEEAGPEDEVYFVPKGGELVPAEHAGAGMLTAQAQQRQEQQQAALAGLQESQGDQGAAPVPVEAGANGNGRAAVGANA